MAVDLEVFGEPVDLLCKEGHLHFRRTRISLVTAVSRYEAVLLLFDQHSAGGDEPSSAFRPAS
jgi:hypothetical protein